VRSDGRIGGSGCKRQMSEVVRSKVRGNEEWNLGNGKQAMGNSL
jgi:hypothetical protein